ncbi:MAG TPA: GtrA family protein [Terriglobales bacterium]|nr:GtrA family protein [Terriglobales bacterium]
MLTSDGKLPIYSLPSDLAGQASRFVLVGVVNTAIDLASLNVLIALTHTGEKGLPYAAVRTVSFLLAAVNSYFLNRKWTFKVKGKGKSLVRSGSQFLLISFLAAVINVGVSAYIVTFVVPAPALVVLWPSMAALAGTASSFALNFLGYKYVVFGSPSDMRSAGLSARLRNSDDDLPTEARRTLEAYALTPTRQCGEASE